MISKMTELSLEELNLFKQLTIDRFRINSMGSSTIAKEVHTKK